MSSKLYVGNLPFTISETDLREAFKPFGSVTDIYIANDRETGRPRGFAFVSFSTPEESKLATLKMNGADLGGRLLTVNEAKPRETFGGSRSSASAAFSNSRN